MLSKITKTLKKLLVSFCTLYGYNIIVPSAAIIPINIITVITITIFNLPGLIALLIIKNLIY